MASDDSLGSIQSLVQFSAKAWKAIREVCGAKSDLAEEAANLWGVLKRSQEEASKALSSLSNPDTRCGEDFTLLCDSCENILSDSNSIVRAYGALSDHEQKVVGFGIQFGSFSGRQEEVLNYFRVNFIEHAKRFSRLLITAATESMGQLKRVYIPAGEVLSFAVNATTCRLMAHHEFRFSVLLRGPGNAEALWQELSRLLSIEGFRKAFLDH